MWASCAEQRCQCNVLPVGTIGPASCVLPAAGVGCAGLAAGPGGVVVVEPDEVQPVTASRTATPTVSAAVTTPRPRAVRPPGRGIDMDPIMPDATRCSDCHAGRRQQRWRRSGGELTFGALTFLQGLAVFGDHHIGQFLRRCLRAELVQGDPAALEQVHPVAHLQDLAVVVRDDDD